MDKAFYETLCDTPIIAAIKDESDLEEFLKTDINIVFILYGDLCSITGIINKVKDANKIAMVHIDLIVGLSQKEVAVDYIKQHTRADGIISTKLSIINRAIKLQMHTVYRIFVIDSMALETLRNQERLIKADLLEILPGPMPQVIKKVTALTKVPVIAGGLITSKKEVIDALDAGATSISTSNHGVWNL
jgi:glycerol uptake operon antiterminator